MRIKWLVLLALGTPLMAQVSNPSIITVVTAPSGACTNGLPNQQVTTTGVQYSCQNGTWGAIAGSGGALTGPVTDQGGQVFNVKGYGAKGDGATNDCAAITSTISAITSAGRGVLFFPTGNYSVGSSCHMTISVPTMIEGVMSALALASGVPYTTDFGSQISSSDTSGVLFTVTADFATFRDIAIFNTNAASGSMTAGSAILTNSANALQNVSYEQIYVEGFYDDIDVNVGTAWHLINSRIRAPRRYGVFVQNTANNDFGDWTIQGNDIVGGASTTAAAIYISTSGGGRIMNNKIQQFWTSGVQLNSAASPPTNQLQIINNNIEAVTTFPIYIQNGNNWNSIIISDNFLKATSGFPGVYVINGTNVFIGNGIMFLTGVAGAVATGFHTNNLVISTFSGPITGHYDDSTTIYDTPIIDISTQFTVGYLTSAMGAQSTATPTPVTNMSWAIPANKRFNLECDLPITWAASATAAFSLVGAAGSPTSYSLTADGALGAAGVFAAVGTYAQSSWSVSTGATGAVNGTQVAHVKAGIQNGATATTMTLDTIANGTNNITLLANGRCTLNQVGP